MLRRAAEKTALVALGILGALIVLELLLQLGSLVVRWAGDRGALQRADGGPRSSCALGIPTPMARRYRPTSRIPHCSKNTWSESIQTAAGR